PGSRRTVPDNAALRGNDLLRRLVTASTTVTAATAAVAGTMTAAATAMRIAPTSVWASARTRRTAIASPHLSSTVAMYGRRRANRGGASPGDGRTMARAHVPAHGADGAPTARIMRPDPACKYWIVRGQDAVTRVIDND